MADPTNRLAMFSAPVADDQVNMLAPQLPPGHPSNMLMWLRDQIPQVQADDTSLASGIYSRLGRTATAIPRAGLETAANWLRGVDDPNAVRIGEDTIAPLGLFGMGTGLKGALTRPSRDWRIAQELMERYPTEPKGSSSKLDLAKKAAKLHVRSHINEYGPLLSVDQAKHVGPLAAVAAGGTGLADQIGLNPVTVGAGLTAGFISPHIAHTREIYKRLKDAEVRQAKETQPHEPVTVGSRFYDDDHIGVSDGELRIMAYEGPWFDAYGKTYGNAIGGGTRAALPEYGVAANMNDRVLADNATASSPGLAANATQEDSPVLDILSKYGFY